MWNSAGITPDFAGPRRLAILAFGKAEEDEVYGQLTGASQLRHRGSGIPNIARSGQLDALIACGDRHPVAVSRRRVRPREHRRAQLFDRSGQMCHGYALSARGDRAAYRREPCSGQTAARHDVESLAAALGRLMILGRMTATERVASFLLELSERNDDEEHVELPSAVAISAIISGLPSRRCAGCCPI